jgi:hypothetical protein
MTSAAIACLILAVSALASCCAAWYGRVSLSAPDGPNQTNRGRFRSSIALSALLFATSSAAIYVAFLLAWAYSSHSINGRQPLGAAAIWVGLISAVYAIVGGLFARGAQRLLIVVSSMAVAFLWILAGAASVAV